MKLKNGAMVGDVARITPKEENYSQWYLDVIKAADLAEYGPVKGTMIIKPDGFSIWEKIKQILDTKFFDLGVRNMYFPLLIPERFLKKEETHVEGFSPEIAVVTYAGGEKLDEALVIRPTSETIIYDSFSRWIQSYADLPILMNQWANVVRWELRPKPFLRTTEFLWQEGHTAHCSYEEADGWAKKILGIYQNLAEDFMAIPVVAGEKSESEKFAGALKTYTVEAMMGDGKSLQFATSHNLGQNFAKVFDVKYVDEFSASQYVWQTSWGLSTRVIGALIMVHGDNRGLVLPPQIAPTKIVILPVWSSEEEKEAVLQTSNALHDKLALIYGNQTIVLDERDTRLGYKHYFWEKKGIPIRIEIGPRELKNENVVVVRRDLSSKETVTMSKVEDSVKVLLEDIQKTLYSKARKNFDSKTIQTSDWDQFVKNVSNGNFAVAYWDGSRETEEKIKDKTGATIRCILQESSVLGKGKCIFSGKPTDKRVIFARSY